MVTVDFQEMKAGKCVFCGKDKDEVLVLSFKDGSLTGSLCLADLRKFLRVKVGSQAAKPAIAQPVNPMK